ncbi:MAG TPA: prepilin peptidase [Blastocatellia bacterium]|jgi:leader peptidase (prepilin peptidase)/N-methyltransferase|nr:prepilin peptidase [Blastocatellia bacterium]
MEQLPEFFFWIAIFIFGLLIGSFLNVVIYRLPRDQSIVFPNSRCPSCEKAIKFYDNIPVLSYAILGGRCRSCRIRISPIYPGVELLVACLYLFAYLRDGRTLALPGDLLFISLIVPLVFIDLEHQLLLDVITYPGIVLMLLMRMLNPDLVIASLPEGQFGLANSPEWVLSLAGSVLGAIAGGGSLWLVREIYFRLRKVEGMGLGDVKMMLMVGVYLGWQLTVLTIFLASLLGSLIGVTLMIARGRTMKMKIPFGVFLGPAALIALFVGQQFIAWYVGLYR